MNYKKEIIKMVNSINQEKLLKMFYSMLRVATSEPDMEEIVEKVLLIFGTE